MTDIQAGDPPAAPAVGEGQARERLALSKVLGPLHIWGLGVGIVLVG